MGCAVVTGTLWACVGSTVDPTGGGGDAGSDVSADVAVDTGVTVDGGGDTGTDADAGPPAPAHVYVTNFANGGPGGAVLVFEMPITSSSTPSVVLTKGLQGPSDVAIVPSGKEILVVDRGASKLLVFDLPLTASSAPVVTIPLDNAGMDDGHFDTKGNFWVGGLGGVVEKFDAPLTSSSTKSLSLTLPKGNAFAVTLDSSDNLYVGGYGNGGIYVYAAPVTAQSTPAVTNTAYTFPTGLVAHQGTLFAVNYTPNKLGKFPSPFKNGSTPLALGSVTSPERITFVGSNLAVADHTAGLLVFAAPSFTTTSVVIPPSDGGIQDPRGVAFGP